MNQEEFKQKLKERYPDEEYVVIHIGKESSDNSTFKCARCERRITIKNSDLFSSRRKHICTKCYYKREDTIRNENNLRERLQSKATNINFFMQERKGIRHNMISFTCNNCGRINTKDVANFLRQKYNCGFCEGQRESKDTDYFLKQLHERHGNKFSLLTEYVNAASSVRIRCNNCGFIRNIKPNSLLLSGFCPKCDKKGSVGEKKIMRFLEQNNIPYIPQMYFSNWKIGLHYFDFYIPTYNLVLEFHGIQHYEFNEHFHKTQEEFTHRQQKDKIKKDAALQNNLNYVSIKYTLMDNLDSILAYIFNSTTIPEGSRGKCLEIETIQDIG